MAKALCGFVDIPGGHPAQELLSLWGPLLYVDIGFDPDFDSNVITQVAVPGRQGVPAQVDTGAGESCIDNLLAAQLQLPAIDRRMTAGAHGAHEVTMYMAQVRIPTLGFTIYGPFSGVDLRA